MINPLTHPSYLFPPLVAFVISIVLLITVLVKSRRIARDKAFCAFLFCLTLWSIAIYLFRSSPDINRALFWDRIVAIFVLGLPVVFYHFSLTYVQTRVRAIHKRVYLFLYLYWLLIVILAPSSLFIERIELRSYGYAPIAAPLMYPFMIFCVSLMLAGLYNLSKVYRTSLISEERNHLFYIIIATLILIVGTLLDAIPGLPPIGIWSNIAFSTITAIAILRYHLLDIRLVIKKGLVYFGSIGLLMVIYGILLFGISQYLERNWGITFWRNALILLVIAISLYPIFRKSQERVDRWFYREKYDHLAIIERFGEEIKSTMDLTLLTSSLINIVTSVLKCGIACLFLPDSEGKYFMVAKCQGIDINVLSGLSQQSILVLWAERNEGFLNRRDIDVIPQMRGLTVQERSMLDEVKASLIIPLKNRDKLSGILVLGPKLSEQKYSEDDLMMLRVVCGQAAVSLDNARLFKEVEDSLFELKRVQEQLVRAERTRALGEMAGGVAHDFNNILAAILGRAQLALDDVTDERIRKGLKVIEQAALDGARTVRRLQDFTRVRADHQFEPVNINDVVKKSLELVEPRLRELQEAKGKAIDLSLSQEQVEPVMGDQGELVETLVNILNNSIDAISDNGKLGITTRQENNYAEIAVSDNGTGIPDNIKNRIGDPYFSTKGRLGMGLGLSVAYGIVNRHGGSIDFDSSVGEGTTFYIKLPIASREKVQQSVAKKPEGDLGILNRVVKKARILVVDDDERIRDNLQTMLIQSGHDVTIAENGVQGISKFNDGDYDLVITDLGMPNVSGWEVAKAVKRQVSVVPVILITGWGVQFDREKARLDGVDEILTKPFTRERLCESIERLLNMVDRSLG